jgi:transposase-like protein
VALLAASSRGRYHNDLAGHSKWHMDEVFIRIRGVQHYLWPAVDQDRVVLDVLVQARRNSNATKRFFTRLLKGLQYVLPAVEHRQSRYLNNLRGSISADAMTRAANTEVQNPFKRRVSSPYMLSSTVSYTSTSACSPCLSPDPLGRVQNLAPK